MKYMMYASLLAVFALCRTGALSADSPVVNFSAADVNPAYNVSFSNNAGGFNLGYKFNLSQSVLVTQLGYYNGIDGGMFMNHDVGLYTAAGVLLATTTVIPTDTLDGIFRYHSIVPVNLAAGDYVLVGVAGYDPGNPVDKYTHDPNNITFDPRFTFIENRVKGSEGNTLTFLTDIDTEHSIDPPLNIAWFGPNMQIKDVNVPEPTTIITLLSMGALALKRKFKKDKDEKAAKTC